ncbi:phosphate propanoyltransferase [bacterium]|jgi:putative phosphotransacetylase|nr:phosphate propanoyltransferase [bacterium]MBT4648720.1 phosphate propanoyltransferase [bacterium]
MKKVTVEVSARHIHLSDKDLVKLFGKQYSLHQKNNLSQSDQFAAKETLVISGSKNKLSRVRILGPNRVKTQVELSLSDCIYLGIKPVLRLSGDLKGSSDILLIGPKGKLRIKHGAIVAKRHLHISKTQAKEWKLKNKQKISASIKGERSIIFNNIIVRVGDFVTRLHLDTDEANAAGVDKNTIAYLDI